MALRPASDSLTRCDPNLYSNIYNIRTHSDFKAQATVKAHPKDTIEISKDKIKEEALQYLRRPARYVIAQNSFMRIGKYLFLAIAFPPYLLVYGMPKWILIEGIPNLFSFSVWMWKKVQDPVMKRLKNGMNHAAETSKSIQQWSQMMIRPFVHLALKIRQRFRQYKMQMEQFIYRIRERMQAFINFPFKKISESGRAFRDRILRLREKSEAWVQSLSHSVQEGIKWIQRTPQMILNWGQVQFQQFIQKTAALSWIWNSPKSPIRKSRELAQKGTDWILRQSREMIAGIKHDLRPLVRFFTHQVKPQWKKFRGACQLNWRKTKDFFQEKHRRALAFVQTKQDKLKRITHESVVARWLAKFPAKHQRWLKKFLSHRIVKACLKGGFQLYYSLAHGILRISHHTLVGVAKSVDLCRKSYEFLREWIRWCGRRFLVIFDKIYMGCRQCILHGLYYFLLALMIFMITTIWSFRFLNSLMDSLMKSHMQATK